MSAITELAKQYSDQWWRLNNLYWIIDKQGKRVKFTPNTSQERLYWDMWYREVILKARQRGFTTFIDIFALDTCIFNPNFSAGIIAHNLEDSKKIFRTKVKYPYDNLPQGIRDMVPANNDKAGEYVFSNGSSISVSTSYRSGTLQLLHVSEYGKIAAKNPEKALEIKTGAMEAVPKDGIILVESTAEGNGGDFYELTKKARKIHDEGRKPRTMEYKFFFEPWFENEDYSHDEPVEITDEYEKYFEELEELGIKLTDGQKYWYIDKAGDLEDEMKREYPSTPDEAFEAAIKGAYFAKQMSKMRNDQRITPLPITPNHEVMTAWDLGKNDTTAIWFIQHVGKFYHLIDYYEENGEDPDHYVKVLREKDYNYGRHFMPHDVETQIFGMKTTRLQQFKDGGLRNIVIVPRIGDVNEGIAATRALLPLCVIDPKRCDDGIRALDNYQKEFNDKTGTYRNYPLHNWASNGVDAIRQFAQGYTNKSKKKGASPQPKVNVI